MKKLQLIKHNNRVSLRLCEWEDDELVFIPKSAVSFEGKTQQELQALLEEAKLALAQPVLVTNKETLPVGRKLSDIEQMFDI